MSGFNSALASITASYTDSDDEDEDTTLSAAEESAVDSDSVSIPIVPKEVPDTEEIDNTEEDPVRTEENHDQDLEAIVGESKPNTGQGLVSYFDPIDDDAIDDYTPEITREAEANDDESLMDTSPSLADESDQVPDAEAKRRALVPPEPKGTCSAKLQSKFNKLYEDKLSGRINMNEYIQNRKMFRNPSIYEKLIQYCGIKEFGTNYPPEVYNPYDWPESSNYLQLAKVQKDEMERREKAKKERVKIEYVSGAAKKPIGIVTSIPTGSSAPNVINPNQAESETKRKSKWDQKVTLPIVLTKK